MIELSSSAIQEIKRVQTSRQQLDSYLRLQVQQGGCEGLYYIFDLWNSDPRKNDLIYDHQGIRLIIDEISAVYLKNLRIDYAEDLMGGGFRFQNPQAEKVCRCGLSFRYAC